MTGDPRQLTVLGWDQDWAEQFASLPGAPARVIRVDRGAVRALGPGGALSAVPAVGSTVVTGDWIAVACDTDGAATVAGIAARRTALVRRDPRPEPAPQVLAANVDEVWVLQAVDQPLRAGWLDRALVVAYGSGATPLVVVTKADLRAGGADAIVAAACAMSPHTGIMVTSTVAGEGIAALAEHLHGGRSVALLGRSGSGKSSLVNALAGQAAQATAAVRGGDARGRHTTTRRALVPVAGGSVIDTPGVRALGLWEADAGLDGAFPDIAALAPHCRFNDCGHDHEPGCAVQRARDEGALPAERYLRYLTLRRESLHES